MLWSLRQYKFTHNTEKKTFIDFNFDLYNTSTRKWLMDSIGTWYIGTNWNKIRYNRISHLRNNWKPSTRFTLWELWDKNLTSDCIRNSCILCVALQNLLFLCGSAHVKLINTNLRIMRIVSDVSLMGSPQLKLQWEFYQICLKWVNHSKLTMRIISNLSQAG